MSESKQTAPSVSFSEQEIVKVEDFVNFVYKNMKFKDDMDPKGCFEFCNLYGKMVEHCKKVRSHIFELVKEVPSPSVKAKVEKK